MVSSFLLLHMIDLVKQNNIYNKTSYLKFVGMEVLDGIVKHTVQQDTMVIYVRRHVSVWIICVINKQGVRHDRVRHVSSTLIKCELTYFFFVCQHDEQRTKYALKYDHSQLYDVWMFEISFLATNLTNNYTLTILSTTVFEETVSQEEYLGNYFYFQNLYDWLLLLNIGEQ